MGGPTTTSGGIPLTFTALAGVGSNAAAAGGASAPIAHLLEIGPETARVTLLLDCGWDPELGEAALAPLIAAAPRVDAVLLSHSGPRHTGALAALVGRHGLKAPIYAAAPVARMGAMAAYDAALSAQAVGDFDAYDLDDADLAFARITGLKYTQSAALKGARADALAAALGGARVIVTPYAAGHALGGAVWRVDAGGEQVVYAPDVNHRKERHLAGASLDAVALRPALAVVGAASARVPPLDRARREAGVVQPLLAALRAGGNALLPVDAAGRVLELLLLLDTYWSDHSLRETYPLALLSSVGPSTLEFAAASLEWMADSVARGFEAGRGNPFHLKNVRMFGSMAELEESPLWRGARPLVVLATGPDLGPQSLSRRVLLSWARDPRSLVLLTQRPAPGSLAAALAAHDTSTEGPLRLARLPVSRRVPLEGAELEQWEEDKRREKEERDAAEAEAAAAAEEAAAEAAAAAAAAGGAGGGQVALRASSAGLSALVRAAGGEVVQRLPGLGIGMGNGVGAAFTLTEGFEPPPGAAAPMFPDEEADLAVEWDAYGAVVDAAAIRQRAADASAAADGAGASGGAESLEGADGAAAAGAGEEERPMRTVVDYIDVDVALRCASAEFEGRSDGRSLATMVAQIAPRQLVAVGAEDGAARAMALAWRQELGRYAPRIVAPALNEEVRLSLAASLPVTLHPQLVAGGSGSGGGGGGAEAHSVGPYRLAWLDGRLAAPESAAAVAAVAAAAAAAAAEAAAAQDGEDGGDGEGGGAADVEMEDAAAAAAAAAASVADDQQQQQQQDGGEGGGCEGGGGDTTDEAAVKLPPPMQLLPGGVDAAALEAALAADGPEAAAALLDAAAAAAAAGAGGVFLGDVQLSEVKQALARAGVASAFRAGKLLCTGAVVVGRSAGAGAAGAGAAAGAAGPTSTAQQQQQAGPPALTIEGPLSDEYYRVRDAVYQQYQVC